MRPSLVQITRYLNNKEATDCPVAEWLKEDPINNKGEYIALVELMSVAVSTYKVGALPSLCGFESTKIIQLIDGPLPSNRFLKREIGKIIFSKDGLTNITLLCMYYDKSHLSPEIVKEIEDLKASVCRLEVC